MATQTPNYGLHQWEPEDNFLRTDFNEDLKKIDEAIKGVETDTDQKLTEKAEMVWGSYTGDGTVNREVSLGFKATAILLRLDSGEATLCFAGVGLPLRSRNGSKIMLDITEQGFQVTYEKYQVAGETYEYTPLTNREGDTYCYAAFR